VIVLGATFRLFQVKKIQRIFLYSSPHRPLLI